MVTLSVAIPTYNGASYLQDQINSILNQRMQPDEIIVQDDCSTDNTVAVAKKCAASSDVPIRIYENETNIGVAENFANSISNCNGELILLSDQDDVWRPNKIGRLIDEFNQSDAGLLCHNVTITSEDLTPLADLWSRSGFNPREYTSSAKLFKRLVQGQNFVQGASILAPAKFLKSKIPFPTYRYDYYLAVTASIEIGLNPVNEQLTLYRQHGDQDLGGPGRTFFHRVVKSLNRDVCEVQYETLKMWRSVIEELRAASDDDLRVSKQDAVECLERRLEFEERRHRSLDHEIPDLERIKIILENSMSDNYNTLGPGRLTAVRDLINVIFSC